MTRVLALADQSKIGCITQRRFAKVGTKTHPQRGADLDRNGLSVSTETACRFEPKSPVGNSEICRFRAALDILRGETSARDAVSEKDREPSADRRGYCERASGPQEPRRRGRRPIPRLILRELSFSGQAM